MQFTPATDEKTEAQIIEMLCSRLQCIFLVFLSLACLFYLKLTFQPYNLSWMGCRIFFLRKPEIIPLDLAALPK